jgi:hypothetical protein
LSWFASLLAVATFLSCATDEEIVFEPSVEDLVIQPQAGSFLRSPTVSRDGRVLAWVRVTTRHPDTWYRVLRWERPALIDTTYYLGWEDFEIEQIDLSDDGRRLVGLQWRGVNAGFFLKSVDQDTERWFDVPLDYTIVKPPQWIDENRILFGALGPEGQGVWCWNPADDLIAPVCVSPPTPSQQWHGTYPDLDRSGRRVCFEIRTRTWRFRTLVCSAYSDAILLNLDGRVPHFWTITPEEEEGLLYIDSHGYLRGVRLSTDENFYVVQGVSEYDISSDGRWLFAKDSALNLRLMDLRNLR